MGNALYNLKIAVKNLEESIRFYESVFQPLGFRKGRRYDDTIDQRPTYVLGNGAVHFELVEMPDLVPDFPALPGIMGPRIEFRATSKEEVDRFHEHLLRQKANVLAPPRAMNQEELKDEPGAFWYAVYFSDPSGIRFGLVYTDS